MPRDQGGLMTHRQWGLRKKGLTTWARWGGSPRGGYHGAVVENPAEVEDHPGVEDPVAQDQEQGTAANLFQYIVYSECSGLFFWSELVTHTLE